MVDAADSDDQRCVVFDVGDGITGTANAEGKRLRTVFPASKLMIMIIGIAHQNSFYFINLSILFKLERKSFLSAAQDPYDIPKNSLRFTLQNVWMSPPISSYVIRLAKEKQ